MSFSWQRIARFRVDQYKLNVLQRSSGAPKSTWHMPAIWVPPHNAMACAGETWARAVCRLKDICDLWVQFQHTTSHEAQPRKLSRRAAIGSSCMLCDVAGHQSGTMASHLLRPSCFFAGGHFANYRQNILGAS
ncbi:Hypothetical protein HDN1F_31220 [gamma proteobacterium HdN1]|nr:Hypothetical protein HDN1F_31220 [gamma proteobacterium HdN1]